MNKLTTTIISLLLLAGLLCGVLKAAATPNLISYQGRLTDLSGTPITTPVNMLFRIHTTQSASADIWSETQTGVQVNEGLFNANLGSQNPLTDAVFNGEERWLSVTIGGTEVIRTRLTAVGYSQRVSTVDRARGGVISGNLIVAAPATKAPGTVWDGEIQIAGATDTLRFAMDGDLPAGGWCGSTGGPIIIQPGNGILDVRNLLGDTLWRWRNDGVWQCGSTGPIRIWPKRNPQIIFTDSVGNEAWSWDDNGEFRCGSTGPIRIRPTRSKIFDILDTLGGLRWRFDDRMFIGFGVVPNDTPIYLCPNYGDESYIRGGLRLGQGSKFTSTYGQFASGLNVGFSSASVDSFRLCVGDANFRLEANNINLPRLTWDFNDWLGYSRASNACSFNIGGVNEMQVTSTGLSVANGINLGYTGAVVDNRIQVGDSNCYLDNGQIANLPLLNMDQHDFMSFDRTLNQFGFTVASTERFRVTSSGVCYVGTIGACSDQRYKKNVKPLSGSLGKITKLRGVNYEWKQNEFPEKGFARGNQIGFIAQEIKDIVPEVVHMESDGYYTVDYSRLTPLLVEAIKELTAKVAAQDEVIAGLKSEIAENSKLRNDVNSLQARIVEIGRLLGQPNNTNVVATAAK